MEELYTVSEVAKMLKLKSKQTVYDWISDGTIKAIKIGKRVTRIPKSELERLLQKEA